MWLVTRIRRLFFNLLQLLCPFHVNLDFLYKTFLCKNLTTFQCVLKSISIHRSDAFLESFLWTVILLNSGILCWLYLWYVVNPWTEIVKVRQFYWKLLWATQWNVDSIRWVIRSHPICLLLLFAFLSCKRKQTEQVFLFLSL